MSKLKWPLFVFAIFCSLLAISPDNRGNSLGGAAAGMWVAFALFHVQDRREALEQHRRLAEENATLSAARPSAPQASGQA